MSCSSKTPARSNAVLTSPVQLTKLDPDFDIRDFDVSPDGRDVVLERVQESSDVALLDLPPR